MHKDFNIYFLEFTSKREIKTTYYREYGKVLFWSDFNNAFHLLDNIKPSTVLFYFIETYNHVALNVTCKYKSIPTFHLEHGIRNYEMLRVNINSIINQKRLNLFNNLSKIKNLKSRIKGRKFFQRTVNELPIEYSEFLKEYFRVRSTNSIFDTFKKVNNKLRLADVYISFSSKIFEFHQKSDHLSEGYPVRFIGIPSFDFIAKEKFINRDANDILFIDNAFESQNIFGWDMDNKIKFLSQLENFAKKNNRKLWVKPHPYSIKSVYNNLKKNENVYIIENEQDFLKSIHQSKVIIGYFSTLLMPLMALQHTICFSLEMHPEIFENKPSMFLVETRAINKVESWLELEEAFTRLDDIYLRQLINKDLFVDQWMYKFDGKSSDRLKKILLENEAY